MYLTEQEKKYCAYVFLEQAKSVKLGLGIAGGVSIAFLVVMCIAMISSMPEGGTFIALFTVLPFAIIIFPLFIWKSRTYDRMYNDLLNGKYQVYRTTLLEKVNLRTVRPTVYNGHVWGYHKRKSGVSFHCQGIDGKVLPLSMDLFGVAKEGCPITVVKFESFPFGQGIVMSAEFDRKIWEWEQKKRIIIFDLEKSA